MKSLVQQKQQAFLKKFNESSSGEEPLAVALRLCSQANTPMHRLLLELGNGTYLQTTRIEEVKTKCREKANTATKFSTYLQINPHLEVHETYLDTSIPDYLRVSFTRLRLSAHRLKVETGRWQRLPRELRTCSCDEQSVQDEAHVLLQCPLTDYLRDAYGTNVAVLSDLYRDFDSVTLCHFSHDLLDFFM